MASFDLYMQAANRYRPGGEQGPKGVRTWEDVLKVARAIQNADADPFNNVYDEKNFDDSPRSGDEANAEYSKKQFQALEDYTHCVGVGAGMYLRQERDADFSDSKAVNQRIKDVHAVGRIMRTFIDAANEMSRRGPNRELAAQIVFEEYYTDRIRTFYQRHKALMLRDDFSLDAIVDFVNEAHKETYGQPLREPFRGAIRNIARIGRAAIGLNGGNGSHGRNGNGGRKRGGPSGPVPVC